MLHKLKTGEMLKELIRNLDYLIREQVFITLDVSEKVYKIFQLI